MAQSNAIIRFIDAAEEPTTTLIPIEGYEKKPLLSLKEAVALIKTEEPIHNLEKMVWAAERNAKNPLDGLTSAQSASIYLYTMEWPEEHTGFCTLLNQNLRSEQRNELKSWFSYLKLFLTALSNLPSIKKVIWRGIKGDVRHLYEKDFIWWGVSSCTETMSVIEGFIGRSGVRTIFLIECINGKAIKAHSFHKAENEIILMPGTYLRVIDKWSPADKLYMIHLREEIPPYQLVAPLTVFKTNQDVSTQTDESKVIKTALPSSPPKYKNPKLEQMINEINDKSEVNWSCGWGLTNNDMEIVAYYLLRNNKTLTKLNLQGSGIGNKGTQYLGTALQNNTTLTILNLSQNEIRDEGAQYLGVALQSNIALTELNLFENEIGDKGAKYLGGGLQNNSTLIKLWLHNNEIGDKGAQYICEGLRNNTTLILLVLAHNPIGDEGSRYLEKWMKNKTTLDIRW